MNSICSITLCAGDSSRMPPEYRPKALCEVRGEPVIIRAVRLYEEARIGGHVFVCAPNPELIARILWCWRVALRIQDEPLGTGHAAACGLDVIPPGRADYVLIAMGDKVFSPGALYGLMGGYLASGDDLRLTVGKTADFPRAGRIVMDGARVVASIEPHEAEIDSEFSNLSIYIGKTEVLRDAARRIGTENSRKEKYLTDIVKIIADQGGQIGLYHIAHPNEVMGFNTLKELQAIRRVYGE